MSMTETSLDPCSVCGGTSVQRVGTYVGENRQGRAVYTNTKYFCERHQQRPTNTTLRGVTGSIELS